MIDLSCRKKDDTWFVAMNKWQTITDMEVNKGQYYVFSHWYHLTNSLKHPSSLLKLTALNFSSTLPTTRAFKKASTKISSKTWQSGAVYQSPMLGVEEISRIWIT